MSSLSHYIQVQWRSNTIYQSKKLPLHMEVFKIDILLLLFAYIQGEVAYKSESKFGEPNIWWEIENLHEELKLPLTKKSTPNFEIATQKLKASSRCPAYVKCRQLNPKIVSQQRLHRGECPLFLNAKLLQKCASWSSISAIDGFKFV